jgi:His-Xaa-Ser system protein HxsD
MDVNTSPLRFDAKVYSRDALLKASYDLAKHGIFSISKKGSDLLVSIEPSCPSINYHQLCNEFRTVVNDHELRLKIDQQTRAIKEAIISAALSEAGVE